MDRMLPPSPTHVKVSGFRHGLRQSNLDLQFALPGLAPLDLGQLDEWLTGYLAIPEITIPEWPEAETDRALREPMEIGWRVILIASALLQSIKIPCFDSVRILKMTKAPDGESGAIIFTLIVPWLENMPVDVLRQCYGIAIDVISQAAASGISKPALGRMMDRISERFIKPTRKIIPGGDSTIPILKAAYSQNIPYKYLGFSIYQLGWGRHARHFKHSAISQDSAIGSMISQNKFQTAHLLRKAGLPVPQNLQVKTVEEAVTAAKQIGFPVVIKPADRDRGEGVTTRINHEHQIAHAFQKALKHSKNLLVEKEISGTCYRIVVANGKYISTVKRNPKSIKGDGVHTIRQLIELANAENLNKVDYLRTKPFPFDESALVSIRDAGFTPESIPEIDIQVPLQIIECPEWGGSPEYVTERVHPENIRIAVKAAELLNLSIAGIDLISSDISIPWHENGAAINETNYSPLLSGRSAQAQAYVELLLNEVIPEKGRIPIEVFVGDHLALERALERQEILNKSGINCCLTSHHETSDNMGKLHLAITDSSLFSRCQALLMNHDADAVILVVQTDEFNMTGLPVDSINSIDIVNLHLSASSNRQERAEAGRCRKVIELLEQYLAVPDARPL